MADNVIADSGDSLGATFSTDDVGGVHFPLTKITLGALDANDGPVSSANPMPVSGPVTNAGTFSVQADSVDGIAAEGAALGNGVLLQGDDGTDRKNVNVDATTGDVQVDVTNTVTVDGSGVTQPVSGTVTANLSATDNAVLDAAVALLTTIDADTDAIKTAVELIDNAISGSEMQVDLVKGGSVADANNSTTTPLGGGATYTGTGTDLLGYAAVCVTIYADVDGATDGMAFQFSSDGTNWDDVYTFTMDVSASDTRRFQFPVTAQYFRVVYTNGAGAQSAFRVQTILHTANQLTSIHRLVSDMSPDRSAQVVKSVLFAQVNGSGDFTPIQANASGVLKIGGSVEVDTALPAGTNAIGKLAANSGVDIGDVDVTSISPGANLVADVGLSGARTSGGTTLYKNIDVDESEDQVKGTAGQVYWLHAINLKATPLFLKLYNATAASVTVGTTVPDLTFPIPSQGDTNGAGFTLAIPNGIAFGTAITIACTTGVADNDSGAPGANECIVNLGYA